MDLLTLVLTGGVAIIVFGLGLLLVRLVVRFETKGRHHKEPELDDEDTTTIDLFKAIKNDPEGLDKTGLEHLKRTWTDATGSFQAVIDDEDGKKD
jgi:hypothetical protein